MQSKGEVVKTKTRKKKNGITEGSRNIFADMGVPEPEQALAKAKLAAKISAAIEEERLKETEAAERLGTDHAKVSAIVRGRLDQFSVAQLLQYAQMIRLRRRNPLPPARRRRTYREEVKS
jgi:predicted XRE-type DNA-binding protein